MEPNEMIGKQFGRLEVFKDDGMVSSRHHWACKCKCGNMVSVRQDHLKSGHTISCGCYRRRRIKGGTPAFSDKYGRYQDSAKERGLLWGLTREEFAKFTSGDCHYCGRKPSQKHRGWVYNGIDRVDNSLGYISENCVTSCKYCNFAKGRMKYDDFLEMVEMIHEHQEGKNADNNGRA